MKEQDAPSEEPSAANAAAAAAPVEGEPSGGRIDVEPEPAPIDPLQAEIDSLRARLKDTEGKLRAVSKAYTDLEADNDSFRRRMTGLADQRAERKGAEIVEQFFEPVRNLRRSMDAVNADPASVIEGLKMIAAQFDDTMKRLGLAELPGLGSSFDPSIHEALATQPVADKEQDGKVLMVFAAGYRLGGKVLQPAQVVIGKYGEPAES